MVIWIFGTEVIPVFALRLFRDIALLKIALIDSLFGLPEPDPIVNSLFVYAQSLNNFEYPYRIDFIYSSVYNTLSVLGYAYFPRATVRIQLTMWIRHEDIPRTPLVSYMGSLEAMAAPSAMRV